MFNKSIAYRLSIFISIAVIGVFLIFITVTYFFNQQLLRENIENRAIGLSSKINSQINRNISMTREVAQNISEQIIYYGQNGDAEKLLSLFMEKYPFLNAIHVAIDSSISLPNHYFLLDRENNHFFFDESNMEIIHCNADNQLLDSGAPTDTGKWSNPYQCRNKQGEVYVSYYCPVWISSENSDKEIAGHVICELSLTEINEAINQLEIGKRGYAFIVNKNGEYITHPDDEMILKQNLYNLPPRVINQEKTDVKSILEDNQTGSAIAYPEILDYKKSWVYYTPTNGNNWFLIFIIPYNELFRELYIQTFQMLLFSIVGIIIIYFIITYISNKLIQPLSSVTSQLNKFSRYDGRGTSKTMDEVKQVSDSLNYLKNWFEEYKASQDLEEIRSHRRKQDLTQAFEIQQSLIKTDFPAFPERNDIDLFAIYKPARIIGGDLFDYFFIDDDNLVFTIGDVSGKGIPAAIFMSISQTIIKNNALYKRAKNIVNKVNKDLYTNNQHQFFLTLFLGILNVKKGELNYCNAAHTTTLLVKPNEKIHSLEQSHGLPLGLYPDKEYKDSKVKLEKGDKIVLYTDGVNEQLNTGKAQLRIERFKEMIASFTGLPPEKMVKEIENKLMNFQGNETQTDDICVFVIEYK